MPVLAIEGDTTAGVEMGILPAETTTDDADGDTSLDFTVECGAVHLGEPKLVRLIVIEAHTNSQTLAVAIITDGTVNTLTTTLNTAAKARVEIPVALTGTIVSWRISGTDLTSRVEIASVELDLPDSGTENPDDAGASTSSLKRLLGIG